MARETESKTLWENLSRAIGAELRTERTIKGASGLDHSVEAIAVDDKQKRILVVAAESNPRIAALMQADIQATIEDARVLVARPIIIDIPAVAKRLLKEFQWTELNIGELTEKFKAIKADADGSNMNEIFGDALTPIVRAFSKVKLPTMNQVVAVIQQATLLDWNSALAGMKEDPSRIAIPLINLLGMNSMDADLQHGVCPIPLYEFTEADWNLFLSSKNTGDQSERLTELGIYQYFFPPPDHVVLGMVERGTGSDVLNAATSALQLAPQAGHPLGKPELIEKPTDVITIAEQLRSHGYLTEGEFGIQITSAGTEVRANVKFRPREGVISKLLQRLNINLSPRDFIGM